MPRSSIVSSTFTSESLKTLSNCPAGTIFGAVRSTAATGCTVAESPDSAPPAFIGLRVERTCTGVCQTCRARVARKRTQQAGDKNKRNGTRRELCFFRPLNLFKRQDKHLFEAPQ